MNGNLKEAKKKLEEMAMRHDMQQADCYNNIRYLSVIMLSMCNDTEWIKLLMVLLLAAVLGIQGIGLVV